MQQNNFVNNTTVVNNHTTVVNNNITMIAPTKQVAVTTDPEFFEENPESLEFWSPGSPAFPKVENVAPASGRLDDLLR